MGGVRGVRRMLGCGPDHLEAEGADIGQGLLTIANRRPEPGRCVVRRMGGK